MNVFKNKKCSACGIEKPATPEYFYPHKGGKFGLRGDCRQCRAIYRNSEKVWARQKVYMAAYAVADRESGKQIERGRLWRKNNLEKSRSSTRAWAVRNPDKVRVYGQQWRSANREKVREKQRRADVKLQQNPTHVLKKRIKARVRQMLRGNGYSFDSLEKILGYSRLNLKRHIERQFSGEMTWTRLMSGEIHIDHIVPISKFNIFSVDDADFKACWALSNLRPLWAKDNQQKQKKVITFL